jgi:hemerythrin-like metal-binding protein
MSAERFIHYTIGLDEVDKQHFELFTNLDKLVACLKQSNIECCLTMLDEVKAKFVNHCVTEEQLMDSYEYPYVRYHKEHHHTVLIGQITSMIDSITKSAKSTNSMYYTPEFIRSFEQTFLNHLDHEDRNFGEWIIKNKKIV